MCRYICTFILDESQSFFCSQQLNCDPEGAPLLTLTNTIADA